MPAKVEPTPGRGGEGRPRSCVTGRSAASGPHIQGEPEAHRNDGFTQLTTIRSGCSLMVDKTVNHCKASRGGPMHGIRQMNAPRRVARIGAGRHPVASSPPGDGRRPWSLMALLSVAQFMVILDATVVNVALPSIGKSLGLAAGGLQWVVTAYVLASGGLVLLGGRAADVTGRRRVFLAGLAVFTAASLASGLAPTADALIAARAGQGLGAALLSPAALSIITTAYTGAQRATALGVWGTLGGAGAAVGVLAGGVLTTWLGWRSVFLVNVPVGVAAGVLGMHLVPPHQPRRGLGRELDLA